MRLSEVGDQLVGLRGVFGACGELPRLRQPSGCEPVVLGAGLDELVLNEALVDWQHATGSTFS